MLPYGRIIDTNFVYLLVHFKRQFLVDKIHVDDVRCIKSGDDGGES